MFSIYLDNKLKLKLNWAILALATAGAVVPGLATTGARTGLATSILTTLQAPAGPVACLL